MLDYDDTIAIDEVDAAPALRHTLRRRIRQALAAHVADAPRVVRVTVALDAVDPLEWLRAQSHSEQLYWSGRSAASAVAAVGVADRLQTATSADPNRTALEQQLQIRFGQADPDAAVRYYGGWAFDPDQSLDDGWDAFGTHRFVLPRFELRTEASETATLACNLIMPHDGRRIEAILNAVDRLVWPAGAAPVDLPAAVARTNRPRRDAWLRMVRWALEQIDDDALDKVVLARRSTFDFLNTLAPADLLHRLHATTPNCFHFLFQPADATAFIGASPERLVSRCGDRVRTEAVAGTRSRGDSARADAALRDELLESEKDRREHAFVADAIRQRLEALCTAVEQDRAASEMRLARGRHLRSEFQGHLRDDVSTFDVLRALHPTPAIGGVPTEAAVRAIRNQEPFARGWYAGPVGWIGPDEAEFAVAIRSGLVRDNTLALYSGAGIVDGSVPEAEWDEIEQKIGDFAAVIDLAS
jgi:menaquinone-specific isochorismate synthase